jgi:DNA repair protein RecN (Recombination protein N)
MLLELSIFNFALIDSLNIEFNKGLNILTGETGAGKSIIIDALGLVLGQRASRDNIRQGQDRMIVEALFCTSTKNKDHINMILKENGIDIEEDSSIIMSREVLSSGKNTCRVNGRMVTLSIMKQLSELLIDIHGQHEHQSLLHWEMHIGLLDSYGGSQIEKLLNITKEQFNKYKSSQRSLNELIRDEMEIEREKDLLKFQLEEINQGKLQNTQEENELENRRQILIHSEKLFQNSKEAYELLYVGNEVQASIYDQLSKTLNCLNNISSIDPTMKNIYEQINSAILLIEDAGFVLRDYNESVEFNSMEIDQIEKRLNNINLLKRKYGESIEDILNYKENIKTKLFKIENKNEEIEKLKIEIENNWQLYLKAANELSKIRLVIARKLEKKIIKELQDLGMKKIKFKVDIQNSEEYSSINGIDRVEFLISTNLGQDLRPLAKIASGGEIARIMLALKTILADADNIDSLIFDEIDTGISGRTAQVVAEKMEYISKSYQTICITHLPQIASMADAHYLIEKEVKNNHTYTNIKFLNSKGRTEELARMLGGATLTDLTISHAKEMLDMAEEIKKNY